MRLEIFDHPSEEIKNRITGSACAVIDVLRMTSTAVTAFHNGAKGIFMTKETDEARKKAAETKALLGGERGGVKLEGFHFGNSPLEYTKEAVSGKNIVISTSNGTQAVSLASSAKRILLASFLNVSAACRALSGEENVVILCVGTKGQFSLDDALLAGKMAYLLKADSENDLAAALKHLYESAMTNISALISESYHYKYLASIGFHGDLDYCLREDIIDLCPEMGKDGWFHTMI